MTQGNLHKDGKLVLILHPNQHKNLDLLEAFNRFAAKSQILNNVVPYYLEGVVNEPKTFMCPQKLPAIVYIKPDSNSETFESPRLITLEMDRNALLKSFNLSSNKIKRYIFDSQVKEFVKKC